MKSWKFLALFTISVISAVAFSCANFVLYPSPDVAEALSTEFNESCISPQAEQRPVWECYEIPVSAAPHQEIIIQHESGERYKVLTFTDGEQTKFRFTPTQTGLWSFSTGGEIAINGDRPAYAKGFVAAQGNKWIRTATGEAFIPQFIMYDKSDLDRGLDQFVAGHGFTGFHITNLRDFLDNPGYFEAIILKTYRRGGATHFWIWGDQSRGQSPTSYGVDVDLLYAEISARLAPLPGWTVGYGFDLFEWATADEIEQFRAQLREYSDYHHMVGGRGHKNQYREISSELDYASWEWHRPEYIDYREHLVEAHGRPAFSEDRFRIRTPTRYPGKDYNPELTLQGLWSSTMAGGVANIWGHKPRDKEFSEPYPNKDAIKTYHLFVEKAFSIGMEPDDTLINSGYCLRDSNQNAMCYSEATASVSLNLDQIAAPTQVIAVDTRSPYQEIAVPVSGTEIEWQPPRQSDWAFWIVNAS